MVVLEAVDAKLANKKISFSGQITIGRGSENDIVLDDIYVSHHHAVISPVRNLYQIEDLQKVVESGKEHLTGLQKGNYGVTVVQGIVTYSYWDYAYISINTRTREITMLRKPEIKTATTFVKYVLEQYGLVYNKDTDFYKLPERIA